jgi:hypothetical protein
MTFQGGEDLLVFAVIDMGNHLCIA